MKNKIETTWGGYVRVEQIAPQENNRYTVDVTVFNEGNEPYELKLISTYQDMVNTILSPQIKLQQETEQD